MATEPISKSVNGTGGLHQHYGLPEQSSQNSITGSTGDENAVLQDSGETPHPGTSGGANGGISKDEVGWYFVEQYYTTLSKNPDKLHVRRHYQYKLSLVTR